MNKMPTLKDLLNVLGKAGNPELEKLLNLHYNFIKSGRANNWLKRHHMPMKRHAGHRKEVRVAFPVYVLDEFHFMGVNKFQTQMFKRVRKYENKEQEKMVLEKEKLLPAVTGGISDGYRFLMGLMVVMANSREKGKVQQ